MVRRELEKEKMDTANMNAGTRSRDSAGALVNGGPRMRGFH